MAPCSPDTMRAYLAPVLGCPSAKQFSPLVFLLPRSLSCPRKGLTGCHRGPLCHARILVFYCKCLQTVLLLLGIGLCRRRVEPDSPARAACDRLWAPSLPKKDLQTSSCRPEQSTRRCRRSQNRRQAPNRGAGVNSTVKEDIRSRASVLGIYDPCRDGWRPVADGDGGGPCSLGLYDSIRKLRRLGKELPCFTKTAHRGH